MEGSSCFKRAHELFTLDHHFAIAESHEAVYISITLEVFNTLKVKSANMMNAYVNDTKKEKVWMILGM